MLKNILAISLATIFSVAPLGVKNADAVAGPALFVVIYSVTSILGHARLEIKGDLYAYRSKPCPSPPLTCPNMLKKHDAYFYVDTDRKIWVGDDKSGNWIPRSDWENIHGKIDDNEIESSFFP